MPSAAHRRRRSDRSSERPSSRISEAVAVRSAPQWSRTPTLTGTRSYLEDRALTSPRTLKSRPLYNPMTDLDPISNIAVSAFALAINPSIPATDVQEFIEYDKANRGKLSYGHSGVGSLKHLSDELFKSLAKLPDLVQVPYRR